MEENLRRLHDCIEQGKVDRKSPYPPQMKEMDGASELTAEALANGVEPAEILYSALIPAMEKVGQKFSENKIFVPQMLMSAKAMGASMLQLKPFFSSGKVKAKGTFIIGTVKGDLHDIGKNLVAMMVEGNGWTIIDLGVDVDSDRFIKTIDENPDAIVGLSALLTTTMVNMEEIVVKLKAHRPGTKIVVGGAPVNDDFCKQIGADFYAVDPQGAVSFLNRFAG